MNLSWSHHGGIAARTDEYLGLTKYEKEQEEEVA
jgi:hypothetical protein